MRTNIESSFEDRKSTYIFGIIAWVYWFYHFLAPKSAGRLLPGAHFAWIIGLFAVCVSLQIFVWIYFKHFQEKWYFKPRTYLFFACELGILTFTLAFILWPVFMAFKSKLI